MNTATASEIERLGIPAAALPHHVAIIMDGNGRWAASRNLDRSEGHKAGARRTPPIVESASRLGIEAMTLYSFSTENWARAEAEVGVLMNLYTEYLVSQRPLLTDNNVRFRHLGQRDGLPARVLDELDRNVELTADNTGLTLHLALNYGSRAEITAAVRSIAADAASGELTTAEVDEALISSRLGTAGSPDPDLLIRTSGEMRISNYLLWQISYAELYVTDTYWPDFTPEHFHEALRDFAGRQRRFGREQSE
ncbi:isoprenyl transferase [Mucisphaera calidilacus]|uniref:Isoprenyl transferase n=1 Tax=Mucisphaera calidilacus TaxID=2527982 RepID=A0A518BW09_9BACT|nr:isoprenyl transferase [Mucisphaera calidilacus]QDU71158.1 Decaprenyl diphosphate synthase-like protein [Mucisphaera calidilacus]